MARYEETQGTGDVLLNTAIGLSPFFAASYFHGKEAQMATHVAGVYSRHLGGYPKSALKYLNPKWMTRRKAAGRMAGALNIAKTKGAFRLSAWGAAKRAGLMLPLAKIAASRAAGLFFAAWNVYMFAPLIYSGVRGAVNTLREIGRDTRGLEFGGDYIDTRGAYTERQRSLRAITSSRMSTRAALGSEAMLMHR